MVQRVEQGQGYKWRRDIRHWADIYTTREVWKRGVKGVQGSRWERKGENKWGSTVFVTCVYYRHTDNGIIMATIHVDDILSVASTSEENERFKAQL